MRPQKIIGISRREGVWAVVLCVRVRSVVSVSRYSLNTPDEMRTFFRSNRYAHLAVLKYNVWSKREPVFNIMHRSAIHGGVIGMLNYAKIPYREVHQRTLAKEVSDDDPLFIKARDQCNDYSGAIIEAIRMAVYGKKELLGNKYKIT